MIGNEPAWGDILEEPFVTLILGSRGSGKTALSHRLLEVFGDNGRDAYIMGFPDERTDLLPEWVEPMEPTTDHREWPNDSVVLVHEAHHILHARRSQDVENLEIDKLVTISRQVDSDIIFETQQSQRLDKNSVAAVDALIVRMPALLQEQFERRAVRPIIEDASGVFDQYVTMHEGDGYEYMEPDEDEHGVKLAKKHAYVHADRFVGEYPHEIELAEHWSEEISTVFGELDSAQTGDTVASGYKSITEAAAALHDPEN